MSMLVGLKQRVFSGMVFLLLCALAPTWGLASENTSDFQPISLQFFFPVSTSGQSDAATHCRLALFFAQSGDIKGLDLTAVAGKTSAHVSGFQMTGIYSEVGGDFTGLGLTGGVHNLRRNGSGIQFSGLSNFVEGEFSGLQFSNFLNYTHKGMFGVQISGLLNINDGYGAYGQFSGVANVNVKGFSGVQASVLLNHANSEMAGLQMAMFNFAEDMNGVQMGVINLTRNFKGFQVGILNFNRHHNGTPIGLFNFATGSRREWIFAGDSSTAAQAGFRSVVNNWSSVVSLGWGNQQGDIQDNFALSWHFGRCFPLSQKWSLTADLGMQHVFRTTSDNPAENVNPQFKLQARLLAEVKVTSSLGVFAGSGLSTLFSEYSTHANSSTEPLFMGGVSFGLDQ